MQLHYLLTPIQAAKVRIEERETRDGRDRELQGVRGDEMSIAFAFGTYCMAGWMNHVYICAMLERTSICKCMDWADASNNRLTRNHCFPYTKNPSS
jgi:hypothetical protein